MIVVFGSVALDLVTNVERIPGPGESLLCDSYSPVPGSKGGNQALAARRAGAKVTHVATVGTDANADLALAMLKEANVNLAHVARTPTLATGVCMVTVADDGENTVVVAAGANRATRVDQLRAVEFGAGDTLILQMEVRPDDVFAAVRLARERGARSVLNVAPAAPIPADVLRDLDVLVMNEHEAQIVAGALSLNATQPEDIAATLQAEFGCTPLITLGEKGALACTDNGQMIRKPAPMARVVDTTGAGDSFIGAFCAALDSGLSLSAAMDWGVAAGSLCCEVAGAQPSIPNRASITKKFAAAD